jgi:hypothetical protein
MDSYALLCLIFVGLALTATWVFFTDMNTLLKPGQSSFGNTNYAEYYSPSINPLSYREEPPIESKATGSRSPLDNTAPSSVSDKKSFDKKKKIYSTKAPAPAGDDKNIMKETQKQTSSPKDPTSRSYKKRSPSSPPTSNNEVKDATAGGKAIDGSRKGNNMKTPPGYNRNEPGTLPPTAPTAGPVSREKQAADDGRTDGRCSSTEWLKGEAILLRSPEEGELDGYNIGDVTGDLARLDSVGAVEPAIAGDIQAKGQHHRRNLDNVTKHRKEGEDSSLSNKEITPTIGRGKKQGKENDTKRIQLTKDLAIEGLEPSEILKETFLL